MLPRMRAVGEIVAARYRVVRQIAEGGMGVLFEAVHISLEERVAIKFVRAADLGADAIARFEREARLAVKLRTEHVARVLDAGRDEAGDPFIVMEYLEGIDLGSLVRTSGPLGAARTAEYLVQACHGLAEAHALTIVHRDVKPANLFLTQDPAGLPIIKVLDFGISKAVDSGGEELTASPERAAHLLGTPHYVSPEQLLTPQGVDARADIWSLGVCGWVMATGAFPFSQRDLINLFGNILNNEAPSIATVQPDLPEAFVRAIDRCLKRERGDRFRDVGELAQALSPMTTERTRPLVEHTVLLLEHGRARVSMRTSLPSLHDELANRSPRVEGRPQGMGGTANVALAIGPGSGAMVVSHTLPVLPLPLVHGASYPPPATLPPPSRGVPLFVGVLVVVLAAVVVVVLGARVLSQLRPPAPERVTPVQASAGMPPATLELPVAAPSASAAVSSPSVIAPTVTPVAIAPAPAAIAPAASSAVAPSANVGPRRPPVPRPAPRGTSEGIPAARGMPSTRD